MRNIYKLIKQNFKKKKKPKQNHGGGGKSFYKPQGTH